MDILGSVGAMFSGFGWGTVMVIGWSMAILLLLLLVFGGIFAFFWYKSFDVKVSIYSPMGQKQQTDNGAETVAFNVLRFRRTVGKFVSKKGVQYFRLFRPMTKMAPMPISMLYDDGVHLIRLSKTLFVPIQKPDFSMIINKQKIIDINLDGDFQNWSMIQSEREIEKHSSPAEQKKVMMTFVIGIAAMVIIGGFIMWLIYKTSSRGIAISDKVNTALESIVSKGPQ